MNVNGWRYFVYGMAGMILFGLAVNKAFAGHYTGFIYVGDEDVTWCIYQPEGDANDGRPYAVRFDGKIQCPEEYDDKEIE